MAADKVPTIKVTIPAKPGMYSLLDALTRADCLADNVRWEDKGETIILYIQRPSPHALKAFHAHYTIEES
jgi:hypothetical protein